MLRRCICFLAAFLPLASLDALEAQSQREGAADFHIQRFDALVTEARGFHDLVRQETAAADELRQAFSRARAAYRRVEYLLDFHYTPYNQLHINGTPFEKYDYESSGEIVPPQGFQRLDELLYLEDPHSSRAELVHVAGMLDERLTFLRTVYPGTRFEDAVSIEAMRSGLVRLFALGLTGFDTPGSPDALEECRTALAAMEEHFSMIASPLDNPHSAALGERLFFDTRLSRHEAISCASCHQPDRAFSDGLPTSGTHQPEVFQDRNTSTLLNAVYSTRQFWDMRAYDLERQVIQVADNEREFNFTLEEMAQRLSEDPRYEAAFERIYAEFSPAIQPRTISHAIAAYVATLRSFDSPFDRYVRGESKRLPKAARRGFNVFMGKAGCGSCHFAPVFNGTVPPFYTDSESEVLGVTVGFDREAPVLDDDPGRAANGVPRDGKVGHFNRSFKTPTVRNIDRTAPYMHNGSFAALEDVVEFYELGGGRGLGLEVENQTLPEAALNLSEREKRDLVAFMKSLTESGQELDE